MSSDLTLPPLRLISTTEYATPGVQSFAAVPGARLYHVRIFSAGGGGGSGRRGATSTARSGGTGGNVGAVAEGWFAASELTFPVSVTIGTKGTGGALVSANDTSGNDGTAGTDSSFGTKLRSRGGIGGKGGTAANTAATTSASDDLAGIFAASSTVVTAALAPYINSGGSPFGGPQPGGSAGSLTTGNAEVAGQNGGYCSIDPAAVAPAKGANGTDGAAGVASALPGVAGSSGAGGGSSVAGAGGKGGDAARGSGGGGGGSSVNGQNSGAGGNGGDGYACIRAFG